MSSLKLSRLIVLLAAVLGRAVCPTPPGVVVAFSNGNSMITVVPSPTCDSIVISPCINSTMLLVMDMPSPVP